MSEITKKFPNFIITYGDPKDTLPPIDMAITYKGFNSEETRCLSLWNTGIYYKGFNSEDKVETKIKNILEVFSCPLESLALHLNDHDPEGLDELIYWRYSLEGTTSTERPS
jgi:hypothetical protein